MCVSDLCRSSAVSSPLAGGIGVRVLPASCVLVPKRYACALAARRREPDAPPKVGARDEREFNFLSFIDAFSLLWPFKSAFKWRSRYNSRYGILKFRFLPFVVASIVAMVFLRRICSSRPGDGEQRGQSLAALTARGRGLYCFQPQPRQPVLRAGRTLCVQTDWAA